MGLRANYQKFRNHLQSDGLPYAGWRGIKYCIFLFKKERDKFRRSIHVKKVKAKKPLRHIITKGKTKIVCSEQEVKIFYNGLEITEGSGLSASINAAGLRDDSFEAKKQIVESRRDSCRVRVIFKDLPLIQFWSIKLKEENQIEWQVDMEIKRHLVIDEFRMACLVKVAYKNWVSDYLQENFPRPDSHWRDLYLNNTLSSLVGVRFPVGGKCLPLVILEAQDKNLFSLVQNSPVDINAHVIGFRHINPKEQKDYLPGHYHLFSGVMNLFEDEHSLDDRIENLRRNSLTKVIKERTKYKKSVQKLKVILANLPWQKDGKWGVRAGSRWPHIKDASEGGYLPFPFFLAYSASLLEKHSIDALLIDAIAEETTEDKFLEKILRTNLDYLVAETSVPSFYDDLRMLKKISSLGIPIILCGPNAEVYKTEFLKNHSFIDFVLYGEYEFTLLDLLKCLEGRKDLSEVKGLIYNNNGTIVKNPKREPFDINLLPWPQREGLPMHRYLDAPGEMLMPSVQILASRGCPFKCHFCLWPQVVYQGNHYRARNVQDVVDEMEYLVKEKGFKSVYFDDDTFNIGKERMLSLCREIQKRGLGNTQWAIMARPDLMDEEILENMKKAGLWAVKYGFESATQSLVDSIGKNMDLRKSEKMVEFTKKLGIKVHLTFTFGLPGETKETIEKTIRQALEIDPFSVQFSITTPFPGTHYYNILEKQNAIVAKDFSHYDGHFKSVIKLENLSPQDLEFAKLQAYRVWGEHLRRKRGFSGDVKKFYNYAKLKGLAHSLDKSIDYLKHIWKNKLQRSGRVTEKIIRCPPGVPERTKDILLIQCPPWDISMPPLGIAYLCSYLEKYGYSASVFDLNVSLYRAAPEDLKYLWEQKSYDYWIEEGLFEKTCVGLQNAVVSCINKNLKETETKIIGLSVNSTGIKFAKKLLNMIKELKSDAKIIVGGWGCVTEEMRSRFPKELVDVFVVGEGEETLKEVIEALRGHRKTSEVSGAIFNKGHQSIYKPRVPIINLDSIPWPTFDEFHLNWYKYCLLPLITSRGCISKCSFCNDWFLSKPYRFRSARNVFEEIKYHVANNSVTGFGFKDLLCNGNINTLNLLSELIINSKLKIHWDSQAIPRQEMSYELLCKLKKSGCITLVYGIESFSSNVLRQMKKIFTQETAERVLRDTSRAGINALINIIVGFPGETEEDFQETFEAIKRNRKYISGIGAISVCLVNNDSDLDNNPKEYKLVLSDDPKIRPTRWRALDGANTYEVRRQRADKIIELVNQLGLSYATATL